MELQDEQDRQGPYDSLLSLRLDRGDKFFHVFFRLAQKHLHHFLACVHTSLDARRIPKKPWAKLLKAGDMSFFENPKRENSFRSDASARSDSLCLREDTDSI